MTRITFEGHYGSKIVVESHESTKDLFRIDDGEGGFGRYHLSEAPELIDAIRKVAGLDKETPTPETVIGKDTQAIYNPPVNKVTLNPEAVKEAIDYFDFSESIEALWADVRAHNERSDRLESDIDAMRQGIKETNQRINNIWEDYSKESSELRANVREILRHLIDLEARHTRVVERIAALEQESLQQQTRRDSLVELREDALESVNDYLQSLEGRTPRRIHQ